LPDIHSTVIIDKKAELADDVIVGPFSIIEGDVVIKKGTQIHSHVRIASGARIGQYCQIHHGAVISTVPQDIKFSGEKSVLEIGDNTIIREYCDLNRGTKDREITKIGTNCLLMAYTHVAHDCFVGNHVILANGVQLGGHVTIEDWVIIGGLVPVHQFCTIGQHAFIGGGFRVVQDVPPYVLVANEPLEYKGLNAIGLKRRGFSDETIRLLRRCYRIIYRSNLNTSQAFEKIESEIKMIPEVKAVLQFIKNSRRGII
jgi:UDP-N-acetylglucosamine acyltransferase